MTGDKCAERQKIELKTLILVQEILGIVRCREVTDFAPQCFVFALQSATKALLLLLTKQCGERLYSPDTVERLQDTVWGRRAPSRMLQTPVFDFAVK